MVSVPVLSLHSTSTPASSSIADSRETIAFCLDSAKAPSAMVTDITAGIATGTEAISRTRTNWAIDADGGPAPDVGHDHVAIDLEADQHAAPGRPRAGSGSRRSAAPPAADATWQPAAATSLAVRPKKVWLPVAVTTRGHRALLGDAARIGAVADPLADRQRLAGQRRLVDAEILAVDQQQIGRHDLAGG